jgi:hypothetical protein
MTMRIAMAIAAVAVAAGCWFGAAARAGDISEDIDCSDTDFKFNVEGYTLKCHEYRNDTMEVSGYMAAHKEYALFAYSDPDQAFIDVIDNRAIGDRVYLMRRSLESDVEGYFGKLKFTDWSAAQTSTAFDTSEFDGGPQDLPQMECIGFRRPVEVHDQGFGRIVVGVACSANGRKHAYDLLTHLTAPGA